MTDTKNIQHLVELLDQDYGVERRKARRQLVELGVEATPFLIEALQDKTEYVRWEAAKALGEIGDPEAAQPLIDALEDQSLAVRWVASESLIHIGRLSMNPLLKTLTKRFDSAWTREGAHHVLQTFAKEKILRSEEFRVLQALEDLFPRARLPWIAEAALEANMSLESLDVVKKHLA
jgi:thioredoxin-like negative regulator of GroEL